VGVVHVVLVFVDVDQRHVGMGVFVIAPQHERDPAGGDDERDDLAR
jgi:hypothetical protein